MGFNGKPMGWEEHLEIARGTTIRIIGSYVMGKTDEGKKSAKLFRREWIVKDWFGDITASQFLCSFVSRVFQNILCPLQSKYVRWTSISITFPSTEQEKTLRQPIAGVAGRMEGLPNCTLGMELFCLEKQTNKYKIQLQGIPDCLDIGDRSQGGKHSQVLSNLESLFSRQVSLAVHKVPETKDDFLDLTLENPMYSNLEEFRNSFRSTETRTR
jgi:hypothetical protein